MATIRVTVSTTLAGTVSVEQHFPEVVGRPHTPRETTDDRDS